MGKYLTSLLVFLFIQSCDQPQIYHTALQTPLINGLTWCGRPFWSVKIMEQSAEYSSYQFEMNLWYGEPQITCKDSYTPFLGVLHAYPDRIELLPDPIHHFAKEKITVFQFGLAPNTIIDSSYIIDRELMAYTKYIDAIPFCGDTLYKFEWDAMIYGYQERRYSTVFFISRIRGLCGMYDYCNEEGGQVLCAMGHTPGERPLPRNPDGIICGAVE